MGEGTAKGIRQVEMGLYDKTILVAPDLDKEFRVEANTSNYATGGVLSMKCSDKKWRPVAFILKSLSNIEQNYKIHNKEMLAVVRCLEAWRHFLEGAVEKFEITKTSSTL